MKPKIKGLPNVFFSMGLASLSWAHPVTHAHRRTSPITSDPLKITYALSREPSRQIHISSLCIQETLTLLCHCTSARDLVPRRHWTHRIQKAIDCPRDFNT